MKVKYVDKVIPSYGDRRIGVLHIDNQLVHVYKSWDGSGTIGFDSESEAKRAVQQLAEFFPDRVIEELVRTGYLYTTSGGVMVVRPGAFIALGR